MNEVGKPVLQGSSRKIRSLQSQYIFAALLLGGLVLVGAALGYFNITSTFSELVIKSDTTSRILELTNEVRDHSGEVNNVVQAFMLNPDQGVMASRLDLEIQRSQQILDMLVDESLIKQLKLQRAVRELKASFISLQNESHRIFNVRVNPNEQFPALEISSEIMRPLRNEINSALKLTLQEYLEDNPMRITVEEYAILNESLIRWVSTLAEYRLYLTNRMGSFDPELLLEQEEVVDVYVERFRNIVLYLGELNADDRFGFEGSILIARMPELIDQWKKSYEDVKAINHSGKWRQDSVILSSRIIPLMDDIQQNLKRVDIKIKQEYQNILMSQELASTHRNYILVGIILLFLLYIIISIKLLQHFIIKPIAIMAEAMKNEAHNRNGLKLLKLNKTKETQDLIDAFSEMNHQVYKRQDDLEYQTMHDSLTGLPNRLMLQQRLDYNLLIASRERQNLTFLMLDLNRFKEINDTLGHHIGDSLLVQVGERLSNLLRSMDTVARLGGDEFAIILPDTNSNKASYVARKINQGLEDIFIVNGYELNISVSIGIAEYPADGEDSHTLMQHADVAMYISKREKSGFHFYSAREDSHSIGRLSLGTDLKSAIESNQLALHYQPKYLIATGEIIGAEALLRWQHPESGAISPEVIIDLAEEMSMINDLSHWVIKNAIAFCAQNKCSISINLSVHNLRDPELIAKIDDCLKLNGVDSSEITFEITESAMMSNPQKSIQALNKLNDLGVKLSVDDFGTGFSSLAYLKLLPVDELKIDKSFVMDIEQDESNRVIVRSTIELSHNLGLKVVAEGIESKDCWDMLLEMGCDKAQGYYMSRPVDKHSFVKLLSDAKNKSGLTSTH